jgi:predicted nucleic acid-binding protein
VIVLDASAFVDGVIGNQAVRERLADEDVHVPHLLDLEVASALRRLVAAEEIEDARAAAALATLGAADIHRHPHTPLLSAIWVVRDSMTLFDAAYVALAAVLKAPLVTVDRRLASFPDLPCSVELA